MTVHVTDRLRDAVASVRGCGPFIQQQKAEQPVDELRADGFTETFLRSAAADQTVKQEGGLGKLMGSKCLASASRQENTPVKFLRIQAVE